MSFLRRYQPPRGSYWMLFWDVWLIVVHAAAGVFIVYALFFTD